MSREYRLYLSDILQSQRRIKEYTKGMTYEEFKKSQITIDAVIRNLEVIGEAARKLPSEITEKSPELEWRKMTAMRNVLSHEYFGINTQIVWDVIANKIDRLEQFCRNLLEKA